MIYFGIILFVLLVYIFLSTINSDAHKKKQIQKRIKIEEEKEIKREIKLSEIIEKNTNSFDQIATRVVENKEKLLKDYLIKIEEKKLNYDYLSKEMTIEEQKKFYEEKIKKLKNIKKASSKYISSLPYMLQSIYNWYAFTNHYSDYLFLKINEIGFDMYNNIKILYDEAIKFGTEITKTIKNTEKAYKQICITNESRKKISKELNRIQKIIVFNNVEIEINEETKVFEYIVCSNNGIFCLHTKYLPEENNKKIYIDEDEQWIGETFSGERQFLDSIDSKTSKNIQEIPKWLNLKLKERLGESVPYFMVYPITIIDNEYVEINNDSHYTVLKIEEIFNHIKLFKGQKIEENYLEEIRNTLKDNSKEHKIDTIDDNTKQLQQNSEIIYVIFKIINIINECCVDYSKEVECLGLLHSYRQYLAMERFLKYKKSVKNAKIIKNKNQTNYINYLQDPEKPLIDRLVVPCITVPLKILAHALDLSIIKTEEIIKKIYNIENLKTAPAISYQYINHAMTEIISIYVSKEILNTYMQIEIINNIKLHKFKYFEINENKK